MGQVSEGGGVAFRSDTLMENCEISDNETLSPFSGGGGIYTDDDFVARQCTISGNLVGRFTGIDGYSVGGAFANVASGDATFEHCTIVNNFAPPGQGQGGGISSLSSGEISFFGSILIGNDAVDLERIPQASTRVSDLGFNFFGTGEGFNLILNRAPTSVYGISSADGILADLAFNGGKTRTHRLVTSTTSSQINAVDAGPTLLEVMAANLDGAPFLFEQRGGDFPRIVNGRLDIGAYEFQTFIDSDDDGLPDAVEQIVSGLDPSVADANDDLDGDSLSNLDEYLLSGIAAMSDPALRFKVQMTQALSEQEMRLSFPASENREYRVLQSSNLALNFTAIAPDYTRFLSTGTQTLSAPATAPRLFFRIEGQVPSELQETDSP